MIQISDVKQAVRLAVAKLGQHEADAQGKRFDGGVTFSGAGAYATWTERGGSLPLIEAHINFPAMPDDGRITRAEADRLTGYALHELGHVFHTDLSLFKAQAKVHMFRKQLLNGLEDPRIEHAVIASGQAPGAAHCFTVLVQSMLAKLPASFDAGDLRQAPFIIAVLGRALRYRLPLAHGTFKIPTALAPFYRIAMDGLRAAPLGKEGTAALIPTVDALMQWIKDNPQPQPQQQTGEGEGGGDPLDGQTDDNAQPKGTGGEAPDGTGGVEVEPDGSVEDLAGKAGKGKQFRPYIDDLGQPVFRTGYGGAPENFDQNVAQAGAKVGQLANTLARLLVSPERCGWDTQRPSGRFDARRSTRAMAGSESVFKQRWERPGLTTDVCLLVDQSGSMRGREEQAATEYLCVMAQALNRLQGVRFAAYGFGAKHWTTRGGMGGGMGGAGDNVTEENPVLAVLKTFDEALTPAVKGRLGLPDSSGGTPDVPAIKACADILRRRDASRKVLIVLTDGNGDYGADVTLSAVKYAVNAGIDVIGIGIGDDRIVRSYPISMSVTKLSDLTGRSMDLLINTLSRKHAA